MKKLQHFKPSLITKEFFPEYKDVSVINEGECFIWAYLAHHIFRNVKLVYNDHHAFVKYGNRFYDSEVLKGSPDWQDLPATEGGGIPTIVSAAKFRWDWRSNPSDFNTSWKELESKARKAIRKYGSML